MFAFLRELGWIEPIDIEIKLTRPAMTCQRLHPGSRIAWRP
ncbi:hypothetical protein ACRAWD_03410 [Caulobacter segnis]